MQTGVIMLGVTSLAVPIVIMIAIQWWPHTPIGRRILIQPPENPDDVLPDTPEYRSLRLLTGKRGRTTSKMLPGGTVMIDRRTYEATSLGMPIEEHALVEVVEVRMNRLVVRPCDETEESLATGAADSNDVLSRPIDSLGIDDPLA
jgi:hypothetical protein